MKVAVVYGQKHQGNTYKVAQLLLSRLDCRKEDLKEFWVNGMGQCVGCYQCILHDEKLCPHRNQTEPIITAIQEAEVVIFASPNYCFGMTGQMKSFCDHMAYRWMVHRPYDMRDKIGIAISSTAGAGAPTVAKEIRKQFSWWSIGRTYLLPFTVWAGSWDEIEAKRMRKLEKRVSALARKVNRTAGHSKPCLKTRFLFFLMKRMHLKASWNEMERKYWEEQFIKK